MSNLILQSTQKIFDKYGTPKEDGTYSFAAEKEQEAIHELEALLDLEVTPEAEVVEIPVTENLHISVNDIGLLMPFIHFVEE